MVMWKKQVNAVKVDISEVAEQQRLLADAGAVRHEDKGVGGDAGQAAQHSCNREGQRE
jgi:hypothetical protein